MPEWSFRDPQLNNGLFAGVAANQYALTLSDIARTNLQTKRNALHLVLGKLPTRGIVAQVDLGTDAAALTCSYSSVAFSLTPSL